MASFLNPKRILWLGSGIFAGAVLAWGISVVFTYTQAPSYDRAKIDRYELYSPFLQNVRKHVVIGSCEVAMPLLANDVSTHRFTARGGAEAWLGNVVNYVLRNDFADGADEFFDISVPNSTLGHHAVYLREALKAENVASILYVNGLGLGDRVSPGDALELMAVVESFERDFPTAAPEVSAYKALLRETDYFQNGENEYGRDWRSKIDPQTLMLAVAGPDTLNAAMTRPPTSGARAIFEYYRTWMKEQLNAYGSGPAYALRWMADKIVGFTDLQRDESIRRSVDWATSQTRPSTIRFSRITDAPYLDSAESPLLKAWFQMVGAVVRAKDARLVIYAQPMLTVTPGEYRTEFRPRYIDRLAEWLAPYDPIFIDHTVDHDLAQSDFLFECEGGNCAPENLVSTGYWANLPGRLKQARLLAGAMRAQGLLSVAPAPAPAPERRAGCVPYKDSQDSCYQW